MLIKYDREALNRLIKNIFDLTGVSIAVLDKDYNTVARCSLPMDYCQILQSIDGEKKLCLQCDKKILEGCRRSKRLECHICRAGLYDSAMPVMKDGVVAGYIIMGRVRSESSPLTAQYTPDGYCDELRDLNDSYLQLPIMTEVQLKALYDLLPSVLFGSTVRLIYSPILQQAVEYIDGNLVGDLSVPTLCNILHVSQSRLYKEFHESLDTTVNEYVISSRMKKACKLLEETDEPIYVVAERSGMENYTYFCRLFKSRMGVTPFCYRREIKTNKSSDNGR